MRFWLIALVLFGVLAGAFSLTALRTDDGSIPQTEIAPPPPTAPPEVSFTRTYKNGVHTVKGNVVTRTSCHSVSATGNLDGDPPRLFVALSIPEDSGLCLERPATKTFSVAVEGPKDIPIAIFVNGVEATATTP